MNGARILVVDDEQLVALDIERRLAPLGYAVAAASSGEEAIERVTTEKPDLVLMDVKLSGAIDGIEAARRIRDVLDVPVIYVTAYADQSTLDRARGSEPYGYILKPFDARELKAAIEMALQRHFRDLYRKEQEALQRFLADASAQLAESLDYRTVVMRAAELITPRRAESCMVCLKEDQSSVPPVLLIHPGSEIDAGLSDAERGSVVAAVVDGSGSQIHPSIVDPSKVLGPRHREILREHGLVPESLMCVPLIGRGRTLGAILFVSARPGRHYSDSDLTLAEDLAHRLVMAIDNALLYREAQRALRLREEVMAVVSHDLRSPLGAILMRAEMLVRGAAPSESARAIVRSAHRMNRLIGDLLDAASIDAARLSLTCREESAGALASEAVDALRPLAQEKSITLEAVVPTEVARASCDHDRILQVLGNLIGNAIHFTPNGGVVTVGAERRGAQIRFTVSDTGPGVPASNVPHLFERFWRAEARRDGAGLGLYIAKGLVETHGGRIGLDLDAREGGGATFFFTLPSAAPAPLDQAPGP
jgi:signal transduction histidine kinase/CheY-like chemotaxis protein